MDLVFQKKCAPEDFLWKEQVRVSIHGIRGSFNDEALQKLTRSLAIPPERYEVIESIEAEAVLRMVEREDADLGIFAFANSGSGGYVASLEAAGKYGYRLISMFSMPVNMCILSHPDVNNMDEVSEFYGHPVALAQCRKTLETRWPQITISPATDAMDTALSAKLLAFGEISKEKAVFASRRAAEIYGLNILAEGVHHDPNNATFFALIRK